MDFNEYQLLAKETAVYPPEKALEYLALGLASEAGEVAGKVKKRIRDGYQENNKYTFITAVESELGDVLWYLSELARTLGIDLEEIAQQNIDKLSARKEQNTLKGNGDNR